MATHDVLLPNSRRTSFEKKWGMNAWEALQALVAQVQGRGFIGPLSLKEPGFLSFSQDVCKSIRIIVSISRCGTDSFGQALFDVVITIWSATIFENTEKDDPWYPVGAGYDDWHKGYVACLVSRLSHLTWAKAESEKNPAWTMAADGIKACLGDFDSLVMPRLSDLRTNADLLSILNCAIGYRPPAWVRSDPPGIRNISLLARALQRGIVAS